VANGTEAMDQLSEILAELRQEHGRAFDHVAHLEQEINAVEAAIKVLRERRLGGITDTVDPGDLRGKTQIEALVTMAKRGNGEIKVNDAKRLLLQAGLIRNPKNASTILYNVIRRSDRFDRIKSGVYRLRSYKPPTSQPRMV